MLPAPEPPATPPQAPARRRRHPILLNLALLAGALGAALLLAEIAIRVVAPQQLVQVRPDIWEPADSLGWANRPNVRTHINTGERTVQLFTDRDGLRVAAGGRGPAETRVLLIGDSFMQALQVEYEQSLAGQLEDSLSRRLGRPVGVWNAGVDGWDPPQYLIRLRRLLHGGGRPFGAAVVALYLGNDVVTRRPGYIPPRAPAVRHALRLPRRVSWREIIDALLYPVNDVLERHSQVFILVKTGLHPLLLRAGLTADDVPEELRHSEAASGRWGLTAELCREMADAARAVRVPLLFLLIPSSYTLDSAALREAVRGFGLDPSAVDADQPARLMRAALEQRDLALVDPLAAFRAAGARGLALYGRVDRHLTPDGHRVLAGQVAPALAELLRPSGAPRR